MVILNPQNKEDSRKPPDVPVGSIPNPSKPAGK